MQNKQIIQRIQSAYSKGVSSDDSKLTSRHIYNKMVTLRTRLIVQELNKKKSLSAWNYQTLPCVQLVKVPLHDCPCIVPASCTISRSVERIPRLLSSLFGDSLKGVYTLNRKSISQIDMNTVEYLGGGRYTSKEPRFFFHNEYLYVVNTNLEVVSVTGVFEDPILAVKFKNFCNKECKDCDTCVDYRDLEFPLDGELVDVLIELAKQDLVSTFLMVPQDNRNNNNDERLVQPENGKQS